MRVVLASEQDWFAKPDKMSVSAGDSLRSIPNAAFVLKLQRRARVSFALPPEKAPKAEDWFGGAVWLAAVERTGTYQVTLSSDAWIDVIQDRKFVRSTGSSGRSDCPGVPKSVRFELEPAPIVLQLSGALSGTIVVAISASE